MERSMSLRWSRWSRTEKGGCHLLRSVPGGPECIPKAVYVFAAADPVEEYPGARRLVFKAVHQEYER